MATRYKGIPTRKIFKNSSTKKEETFVCTLKTFQKKMLVITLALPRLGAGGSKTDDDEDYIVLSLDNNGELLLGQFPLTEV